ncbi:hypothetical protein QO259_17210 [Salinicola sp. JS01]|uniref:hypothetical protein n=1 Tax=Salinicola sp. JS01 TaxID=3050071 RepID=UPI00255B5533|nr:hypothetical protein [Salinicola sp. JS01]WIX32527.1 hypothetical protein QO259_17210 [Salinicola sp. JS01]
MINAAEHHDPALAPGLIRRCIEISGSQLSLASRLGVSARFLRMVSANERRMDYCMQVALERIIEEAE